MKPYEEMNNEELAQARIQLDEKIAQLRSEKKKIQNVIDARLNTGNTDAVTISNVGGIKSEEKVGKNG